MSYKYIMGNYLSSEFYLYTRKKATDQYELQVEFSEGNPMSRFKHEVYAYALNKNYKDDKSLYLYCGYQRVAKAHICGSDVKFLEVSFVSEEVSEEWDSCQEQMPNIYVDICWLEREFNQHWVFHVEENILIRKYQNYKMDMMDL